MRLLVFLAQRAGEVVSIDELLDQVWSGVVVSPDSVYQAIAALRRLLGDDARQPQYISTVPRLGYRMVASVSAWEEDPEPSRVPPLSPALPVLPAPWVPQGSLRLLLIGGLLCVLLIGTIAYLYRSANLRAAGFGSAPAHSIAVLPLLDLTTREMNEEYFADGLTEELIDRLSGIPGLRVPAPESSFYYKDRKLPVTDIARALNVAYVLSGNVRKSGSTLRIAVRLIRASDGYVIWSQSFDGSYDDKLKLQDDIAGAVARTLRDAIRQVPD